MGNILEDLSDYEIIEAYHYEYYDSPEIQKTLKQLGIDEHEVSRWIYLNIK